MRIACIISLVTFLIPDLYILSCSIIDDLDEVKI